MAPTAQHSNVQDLVRIQDSVDNVIQQCNARSEPAETEAKRSGTEVRSTLPSALMPSGDKLPNQVDGKGAYTSCGTERKVLLHVYEIAYITAIAKAVGLSAYHVGIEMYKREYCFGGSGIQICRPSCFGRVRRKKACAAGQDAGPSHAEVENYVHRHVVPLGYTTLDPRGVKLIIKELRRKWVGKAYNMWSFNCQSFATELCQKLGLNADCILAQYCSFTQEHPTSFLGNSDTISLLRCCQPTISDAATIIVEETHWDVKDEHTPINCTTQSEILEV